MSGLPAAVSEAAEASGAVHNDQPQSAEDREGRLQCRRDVIKIW